MKFNKIFTDGHPRENPNGSTRINTNVVLSENYGAFTNERGFEIHSTTYQNLQPNGLITIADGRTVIFSVGDGGTSEIGILDVNGHYTTIVINDLFNFSIDNPVHGEYTLDENNNLIVSFVDDVNPPRIINLTNPPTNITDETVNVFINAVPPQLISAVNSFGGNLEVGAYYPFVRYKQNDGTVSNAYTIYKPVYIVSDVSTTPYNTHNGDMIGSISSKSIRLNLSGLNTDFDRLEVGVIFQKEGVRYAHVVDDYKITAATFTTSITSLTGSEEIDVTELLIPKDVYSNAKLVTQQNNSLFFGDLTKTREPNHQPNVNNLILKWTSELTNLAPEETTCIDTEGNPYVEETKPKRFKEHEYNNVKRHFQHSEVYAFYIRFYYPWGIGKYYPMIGRMPSAFESQQLNVESAFEESGICETTQPRFRVENTAYVTDNSDPNCIEGTFGAWINETEQYPNNAGFPNTNVRHFRFPSLNWCRNELYPTSNYGVREMDILGIKLENLDYSQFADCDGNVPTGYEIGFAKRDNGNNLVVGQSIYLEDAIMGNIDYSTDNFDEGVSSYQPHMRTYPPEMLYNRKAQFANFIQQEYALVSSTIEFDRKEFDDPEDGFAYTGIVDYIENLDNTLIAPYSAAMPNKLKGVEVEYIPNNLKVNDIDNTYLEAFIRIPNQDGSPLPPAMQLLNQRPGQWLNLILTENEYANYEATVLYSFIALKSDLYARLDSQFIVSTGYQTVPNIKINGGDCYICDYTVNTYNLVIGVYDIYPEDIPNDLRETPDNGGRMARRFYLESVYNINLRHVNPNTETGYTEYYPNNQKDYLYDFDRTLEPNALWNGYNVDNNALLDLSFPNIWNGDDSTKYRLPFRVIGGEPFEPEDSLSSWRTFKANNYFEMPKIHGTMVNLEVAKDLLYIHMQYALYRTRGRVQLFSSSSANVNEIFLGSGKIFENIPTPIVHDDLGHLGTQHRYSCIATEYGYLFCDAEKGAWFLVSNSVKEISANGLKHFFYNNSEAWDDNPFHGEALEVVHDEEYDRFIVSRKHKEIANKEERKRFKGIWKNDINFVNSLQSGDIVFRNGQYQRID